MVIQQAEGHALIIQSYSNEILSLFIRNILWQTGIMVRILELNKFIYDLTGKTDI